ncbi:Diacylglycerol kinase [Aquisphaera giovannonii]|uniref:Diacylglycerol kinase n=1 Tax=Aquisphaera giovannonii TaxID=406548 RepID=A0A5B9W663_9BACT|nr:diacylglycerol kinase family protein [Aquisphaera giovannonii]QEH35615.1 Diacylglycerol kinase [Aquisphaera giovannonii]
MEPPPEGQSKPPGEPLADGWVGVIANRASGRGAGQALVRRLCRELAARGYETEVAWTVEERLALVERADRASGCRCLVAVGGDGTVSALVNERPRVPITVLPCGTENLASQHFRLRRNPAWLAREIAAGHAVRVDVGSAAGRRFLLMVGFGFDGDVVTRHHRARTASGRVKPTHRAAYVEPILRASLFYRFHPITVRILDEGAEEDLTGTTVFIFNLPRYALGLPFAPHASQDDGLLDLVIFRDPGPFKALYYLWRVFRGTHLAHPGVFHRRVRRLHISSAETIPVQLDGDPAGFLFPSPDEAPDATGPTEPGWTVEVIPDALEVLTAAPQAASPRKLVLPLARGRFAR